MFVLAFGGVSVVVTRVMVCPFGVFLWVAVEPGWFVAICCGVFRGFVGLVTVVWLAVGWSVGLVNSAGLLS